MPASPETPQTTNNAAEKNSPGRRFLKWGAAAVGGAILAGIGGTVWTTVQEHTQQATAQPIEINVEVDPSTWESDPTQDATAMGEGYYYWLPLKASELPPAPDWCPERRQWAWGLRGADAGVTRLQMTLRGNRSGEVSFDSMRVIVDSREPVTGGTVAACPVGGASADTHGLEVDLDQRTVRFVQHGDEVPARFTLAEGETEAFQIVAYTSEPDLFEWHLELGIVDGSERRTVEVQDGNAPFRTTSYTAGSEAVVWKDDRWILDSN